MQVPLDGDRAGGHTPSWLNRAASEPLVATRQAAASCWVLFGVGQVREEIQHASSEYVRGEQA